MSSFTKPFKCIIHNVSLNDNPFEVAKSFEFYSTDYQQTIKIPKGYRSDFGSVPRSLWPLFPPVGRYSKATVVHDWMIDNMDNHDFSIHQVNKIFREAMKVLGVGKVKRNIMFAGVNIYWRLFK